VTGYRVSFLLPAVLLLVLLTGACSDGATTHRTGGPGSSASCAGVIEIDGTSYIAGRGSDLPVPETGASLRGRTLPCDDGTGMTDAVLVTAHRIPGVAATDAVAADGWAVMLGDRLWQTPWAQLPPELQQYVRR
jgi:hypothetical protein